MSLPFTKKGSATLALAMAATTMLGSHQVFADTTTQVPNSVSQQATTELDAITVEGEGNNTDAIIRSEQIEKLQADDLADLFNNNASISVGGGVDVAQRIYMRGIEDTFLNVTIDGASQVGQTFHHTGRIAIEPELLKQVEISSGAGEATNGPGALGGSVRFVTKDPEDLLKPGENFGALLKAGYFTNNDAYKASTTLFGRANDSLSAMASFVKSEGNNFEDGDGDDIEGSETDSTLAFVKLVGQLTDNQKLSFSFNKDTDEGERSQRPQWIPASFNLLYPLQVVRKTHAFNYEFKPANNDFIDLQISLNKNETDLRQDGRFGLFYGALNSYGLDIRNTSQIANHEITYGFDYRDDEAALGPLGNKKEDTETGNVKGVYVQDHIALTDQWELSLGARYDNYELDDRSGDTIDADGFSPNIGLTFQATEALSFNARYAEALKGPEINGAFKLYGVEVAHDIDAEESKNFEVGFDYNKNNFNFAANVYVSEITDAITDISNLYQNIGDVESKGLLASVGYNWQRVSANLSYHYNDIEVDSDITSKDVDANMYDHNGIATTIGDTLTAEVLFQVNQDVELGWNGRFVKGVDNIETSLGEINKAGFAVHDIYGQWLPTGKDDLKVTLTVRNLFDKRYLDHASNGDYEEYFDIKGAYDPGRDIRLSVSWEI